MKNHNPRWRCLIWKAAGDFGTADPSSLWQEQCPNPADYLDAQPITHMFDSTQSSGNICGIR